MALVPSGGGLHGGENAEVLHIFASREAAEVAASNLRAHGVHCWITSDDAWGVLPNLAGVGGVRLWVHATDAQTARALLDLEDAASPTEGLDQNPVEEVSETPVASVPRRKWAPVQIFFGVVAGVFLCLIYQGSSWLGMKARYHFGSNKKPDQVWIYKDGHLVKHMRDRNHDGVWDYWAYHENGVLARVEEDNNFDGKPDETWTYSNEVLVRMEKDTDFNGTSDMFCTYSNGLVAQVDYRPNGAFFATQRHIYRDGVLKEILREADADGHFTEAVYYDPFFNLIATNKLR